MDEICVDFPEWFSFFGVVESGWFLIGILCGGIWMVFVRMPCLNFFFSFFRMINFLML